MELPVLLTLNIIAINEHNPLEKEPIPRSGVVGLRKRGENRTLTGSLTLDNLKYITRLFALGLLRSPPVLGICLSFPAAPCTYLVNEPFDKYCWNFAKDNSPDEMNITSYVTSERESALLVGDYNVYRAQATRRIHSLRKRLGQTTQKGRKYIPKAPVTADDIQRDHEYVKV